MTRPGPLRAVAAAAVLGALALTGCGKDGAPPPTAPAPPPPGIVELHPPPRSTRQPFDVESWARFDAPLDPATVNEKTVFLMLDTRRVPCDIGWDAPTSRLVIRPREPLTLARTHTVQLSTAIRSADGTPLASVFEWQYRVIGVRVPEPVYPAPGAPAESPHASPDWRPTEPSAGDVRYAFYAGTDSLAVAARALPPLRVHAAPLYLPEIAWPSGGRVWWAVTTENRTVDERIDGPVSWFEVLPATTRIDSVGNALTAYGWASSTGDRGCNLTLYAGGGYVSGILWNPLTFGGRRKLAGAWVETGSSNGSAVPRIFGAASSFNVCALRYPGPPYPDPGMPELAAGIREGGSSRRVFRSAALTAQIERALRGAATPGFLFTSGLFTNLAGTIPMSMRLYYYVTPSGPRAADATTAASSPPPHTSRDTP